MRIETLAVHIGHSSDSSGGAVAPPLVLSTTFARDPEQRPLAGHTYARSGNPNRDDLERLLAALEGGDEAVTFSSGQAATHSVLHALSPGDHLLLPAEAYYGTLALAADHYERWGLIVRHVDMTDQTAVERALRIPARLVWIETPSNPRLQITDIAAVSRLAHGVGAVVVVDNTWATPIWQRPLDHGADLVLHSATKYLGGHSDLTAGAVIARRGAPLIARIRDIQGQLGAVPSPFDCWLLQRSIPTLAARVRAQSASAATIAAVLAAHPDVRVVHYPGLGEHPHHDVAARQMAGGYGGMLAFELRGGREQALAVAARVRLFQRATSLGGYESLIEHRASVEGPRSGTPPALLRLSIGLEHVDDLLADLSAALALA
jgi:cystathionine gamma-synthase